MSSFKPLLTSDVIVSPFEVNKSFTFEGSSSLFDNGIERLIGKNIQDNLFISGAYPTGYISTLNQQLVYSSIKELYYSNFLENPNGSPVSTASINLDGTLTGSISSPIYYNYPQTTLTQSRYFPTSSNDELLVISIPSDLYGEHIMPGSIIIQDPITNIYITDNEEGNLVSGSQNIGNIIYQHGVLIITNELSSSLYNSNTLTCSFSSSITLFETQYRCNVRENEFNFSTNPTLLSGSYNAGILNDFATGSFFNPYITTLGLYNNNQELLAVAKFPQPIPLSSVTDTNIMINLDL
jgi:hypothetical protein